MHSQQNVKPRRNRLYRLLFPKESVLHRKTVLRVRHRLILTISNECFPEQTWHFDSSNADGQCSLWGMNRFG